MKTKFIYTVELEFDPELVRALDESGKRAALTKQEREDSIEFSGYGSLSYLLARAAGPMSLKVVDYKPTKRIKASRRDLDRILDKVRDGHSLACALKGGACEDEPDHDPSADGDYGDALEKMLRDLSD